MSLTNSFGILSMEGNNIELCCTARADGDESYQYNSAYDESAHLQRRRTFVTFLEVELLTAMVSEVYELMSNSHTKNNALIIKDAFCTTHG